MTESKPEYYGIGDPEVLTHQDRDECIEAHLDNFHPEPFPETVKVVEYQRMEVSLSIALVGGARRGRDRPRLDEDYGGDGHDADPRGDGCDPGFERDG